MVYDFLGAVEQENEKRVCKFILIVYEDNIRLGQEALSAALWT